MRVEKVNDNKKVSKWTCYSRGTTEKNERGCGKVRSERFDGDVRGYSRVGVVPWFVFLMWMMS